MIGPIVAVVRDHVLAPQADAALPEERRLYLDPDNVPLNAHLHTAEVVPADSTPVRPELGPAGTLTVRHTVYLVVAVEAESRETANTHRDPIVADLLRRATLLDWTNLADLPTDVEVVRSAWTVSYADLEPEQLAAWATVTFTVDTEWTL